MPAEVAMHEVDETTEQMVRVLPADELYERLDGLIGEAPRQPDEVLGVYTSVIAPSVISLDSPRFLGFICGTDEGQPAIRHPGRVVPRCHPHRRGRVEPARLRPSPDPTGAGAAAVVLARGIRVGGLPPGHRGRRLAKDTAELIKAAPQLELTECPTPKPSVEAVG